MRPRSNSLAQSFLYRSVLLLLVVALAVGVLMVLWPTLPVQAQSESTDNDTDAPQPTGEHLIVFGATNKLPTDYEQRIANLGGKVEDKYEQIGVVVASGLSEEAAESLESFEDVQVVEQDMQRQWLDPTKEASVEDASAEVTAVEDAPASPDEPTTAQFYPRQWNLQAIKADKAWEKDRLGSSEVTVAILDTGIDGGRNDRGPNPAT
jgi:hypothetical protein